MIGGIEAGPAGVSCENVAGLRWVRERAAGHGVRSAEDPRLLAHLAASGVTLEVAITSNVQTGATRSRTQHQLAALAAAGVRVALCTDNPAVSDTRLTHEYELARDLVDGACLEIIRQNALAARFISPDGDAVGRADRPALHVADDGAKAMPATHGGDRPYPAAERARVTLVSVVTP